nr:hypothetical protein [uncultured Flavobacterium sp.]
MKKTVFTLITALLFSFNCFSQENNDIFTSVKYIELRDYYIESINSIEIKESQIVTKELIDKIGKDNFPEITKKNSIAEWLKKNWQSTSFSSFEEAQETLTKFMASEEKSRMLTEKMAPLFTELRKEVGYAALFKKLSEDYNKSLQN